jgi:hypothetical protein
LNLAVARPHISKFLSALISDIKDNDLIDGVTIDIWNEPDGRNFWDHQGMAHLLIAGYRRPRGHEPGE